MLCLHKNTIDAKRASGLDNNTNTMTSPFITGVLLNMLSPVDGGLRTPLMSRGHQDLIIILVQ